MTPALVALARRAVAAGAPPATPFVVNVGGDRYRSGATGLVYDRATRLPLLSDSSWIGWTLAEVERRGYWACLSTRGAWGISSPERVTGGDPDGDIPASLVAMLEATLPEATPAPPTTPQG